MNDYILFDAALRDRFTAFLKRQHLSYRVRPDRIAGFVISLPDDLDDEVEEAVEAAYEALMAEQQELVETEVAGEQRAAMTVTVGLSDGRMISYHLPGVYARRLHEHFSLEEIRDLVAFIAQHTVDPASGPACRQP